VSFPILSTGSPNCVMLKLPRGVGLPGVCWDSGHDRSEDLRACSYNDATRLRIATVTGITGSVENIGAVGIVQNDGSAVVAAVGVGQREVEIGVLIHLGYGTVSILSYRVGRIDNAGSIGIRDIDRIDRRKVPHKGQVLVIAREIQRYFGFGREAGYQLVGCGGDTVLQTVRYLQRGKARTGRTDLIEKDGGSNAKTAIGKGVVPNGWGGAVIGREDATAGDDAIGRQGGADRDVTRVVVVDAATDYEVVGYEICAAALGGERSAISWVLQARYGWVRVAISRLSDVAAGCSPVQTGISIRHALAKDTALAMAIARSAWTEAFSGSARQGSQRNGNEPLT